MILYNRSKGEGTKLKYDVTLIGQYPPTCAQLEVRENRHRPCNKNLTK